MKHIKLFEAFVNEGKLTKKDFDKVVKAVEKSKQHATVLLKTKTNEIEIIIGLMASNRITDAIYPQLDKLNPRYSNDQINIVEDDTSLVEREYDEVARVNGGHKDYYA